MSNIATMQTVVEPTATPQSKTVFGFWLYLMTDCVLFATLFAVYAVLHDNTNGGPSAKDLFSPSYALVETIILLASSFTAGLGLLAVQQRRLIATYILFSITFALGVTFLTLELSEFRHLYIEGHSWRVSGFLSSFFTLVSTHGLHIASGLIWMLVLLVQLLRRGYTSNAIRRFTLLSIFWHFLDVIWIFIFTLVYLLGAF